MKNILTEEGANKIKEELNNLLTIEMNKAINELAEAAESGSIEENTQYRVAREECQKIQNRISNIEHILTNSIIVDEHNINTDKVSILTTVKVLNKSSKKEMEFTIVPDNEIDIKQFKISTKSPVGSGLIGKKIGDLCKIKTPSGICEYSIIDIYLKK
jgi:transcription elongation factor GreA